MYKKIIFAVVILLVMFNLSYAKFNNIYKKSNNYDKNNLNKYVIYNNTHKIDPNEIVNIVNSGLDQYDEEYIKSMKEILNDKYFIKSRMDRYYQYSLKNKLPARQIVENVNCNLDYPYYTNTIQTDISKGKLMIVNKYYALGNTYNPDVMQLDSSMSAWGGLVKEAHDAFVTLHNAALKDGYNITNQSPYRSFEKQYNIYNSYVKVDGVEATDRVSARPGYSEHQSGYALDVGDNFQDLNYFGDTKPFYWMQDNAYKYGFIMRYPEGKNAQTGYDYEPWHYRYVGKTAAEYIHKNKITFDEYYAYFVENKGV